MEINNFLHDLLRHKFLSQKPINKEVYTGRGWRLHTDKLNELWIHTNNSCNLACSHCLVDSGPGEDEGLPAETVKKIINEAIALGTHRFYFTGGEPLQRKNIFELIDYIGNEKGAELILTKLIAQSGGKIHHLLWAHKRGRITQNGADSFAPIHDLLETIKRAKIVAEDLGVFIDNLDAYTFRANSNKGTRYDLGNACYDSCIFGKGGFSIVWL
ncbi:MAG: radical SAM protein [Candidatus Brocadiaceae bacterium]|nr:radical SAM protein [Candidatus Brocadiaceae bacterium]